MKLYILIFLFLLINLNLFAQSINYKYDILGRLTQTSYPDSCTINYTYDASGNRTSLSTTNICYSKSIPSISLTGNNIFCSGDSVKLTSSNSTSYLWSTGETTQSIYVKKPGKYAVTAIYSSSCSKFSDSVTIKVNPLPIAKITPSGNPVFCEGDSIILQAETTNESIFKWSTGSSLSSIKVKTTGIYKLVVINAFGCKDSTSLPVTVNPLPIAIAGANQIICEGPNSQVQIGSPPVDGYTYSWTPTTGLIDPNIANPFANPSVTTSYVLKVTNAYSCSKYSTPVTITVNPRPVAKIIPSGNTTFCEGDSIILKAQTSNTYSYNWSTGSTSSSIKVKTTGIYKLLVTDTPGCQDSTNISVTVNPLPTPIAGTNKTICEGPNSQVQIGSPPVSGNTYSWTPTTGLNDPTLANPFANPSLTTTYVLKVTNAYSCSKYSTPVTITVNPRPLAKITPSANTTFCAGDSITLQAQNSNNYSYKWSTGASTPSIKVKTTGIYKLLVTTTLGCQDSTSISVTVNPLPVPLTGPNRTICEGPNSQVQIGSPPIDGYTYSWTPTTGLNNPLISNPFANPSVTTTYSLKVTNSYSCSKTSNPITITVNPRPKARIIVLGSIIFCDGDSAILQAETSNGYHYKWSTGANSINIVAKTTGVYKLLVTNDYGCSDSTSISITVNPIPVVITGNDQMLCDYPQAQVELGSSPIEGYIYTWTPKIGLNNVNIANPIATPLATTTYTLKVINTYGCMASKKVTITRVPIPIVNAGTDKVINRGSYTSIGGANTATGNGPFKYNWTPNSGLSNETSANPKAYPDTSTLYTVHVTDKYGCVDSSHVYVKVIPRYVKFFYFPNPTKDVINILGAEVENGKWQISLITMLGVPVIKTIEYTVIDKSFLYTLPIKDLTTGTYILKMQNGRYMETHKIFKIY